MTRYAVHMPMDAEDSASSRLLHLINDFHEREDRR
jgi:hypothetical protein